MEHKEHKGMPNGMPKSANEMDMNAMHKEMGTEHHSSHDEIKKKHDKEMEHGAQKMKKPGYE